MKKYALIGQSLSHSFSKRFFEAFFTEGNIAARYENIELTKVEDFLTMDKSEFSGFNVTIPYKSSIMPFLDKIDTEAMSIGAVNTIAFRNGKTIGYNTDAFGFQQSIKPFLTWQHETALVLGTGGASKAVEFVLKNLGIKVFFLSRQPKGENQFSYDFINSEILSACKLIVNTTPVGMFPNVGVSPLETMVGIHESHLMIDLIYNPEETLFLKQGKEMGATTLNGLSMLKAQALKSWALWNDV